MKKGILLINIGSPLTPAPGDVFKYLVEFLTDERVMPMSWLKRQLLVRGVIVPMRYRESARNYAQIWTEKGSPLMVNTELLREKVQARLPDVQVESAMRYGDSSIEKGLERLRGVDSIVIFPLFPQYSSATVGSIHEKVMQIVSKWERVPELKFISRFYDDPLFIEGFTERGRSYHQYDHVLFSFHGLPEKQKGDYGDECEETARLIAKRLGLDDYSLAFQSRLGKEVWMQPYTSDVIVELAKRGVKRLCVFCPSFVADCLETLQEIGVEYAHLFKANGGDALVLAIL